MYFRPFCEMQERPGCENEKCKGLLGGEEQTGGRLCTCEREQDQERLQKEVQTEKNYFVDHQ